jgi:hypothetical protein
MPTASSAQMSSRTTRIPLQAAIRYLRVLIFLTASSHIKPVPDNRIPATTKSNSVQFTSFVNCIAINGISNSIAVIKLMISLLFCIVINVYISVSLRATWSASMPVLILSYLTFVSALQTLQFDH